jgi:hypothetical protein
LEFENRPRSPATVAWAADSLRVTNAGIYELDLSVVGTGSANTTVFEFGFNNASPNNPQVFRENFPTAGEIRTFSYSVYYNLAANSSIKPKFKRISGSDDLRLTRAWMTIKS